MAGIRWTTGLALGLLAAVLWAAEPPAASDAPAPAAEASETAVAAPEVPPADGLKAYVDPATGELVARPGAEQVERLRQRLALSDALRRDTADLEPFFLSGQGRGVYLEGRFQNALVVRANGAGGWSFACVDAAPHEPEETFEPAAATQAEDR